VFSLFIYQVICAIFWFSVGFSESLNFAFLGVQGVKYKKILRQSDDKILAIHIVYNKKMSIF